MSLLLREVIIAAKKNESNGRHHTKKKVEKELSSSYLSFFIDYVKKEMSYNCPELLEFFKVIGKRYYEEYDKDQIKLRSEKEEIEEVISKDEEHINTLKRQFLELDITIDYDVSKSTLIINGIPIKLENLKTKDFEDEISLLLKEKENSTKIINDEQTKITELKEKRGLFLSKRKKEERKKSINNSEEIISNENIKIQNITSKVDTYNKIANLSDEERKNILRIAELKGELFSLESSLSKIMFKLHDYDYSSGYSRIDYDVITKTFETMIASGEITQDSLEKIFSYLDELEIKAKNQDYNFKSYSSEKESDAELLEPVISWFIHSVYMIDEEYIRSSNGLSSEDDEKEQGRSR